MSRILHIDSDDVQGLSKALLEAISRNGISIGNPIREYDYPEDDEPDVDPYLGIMPRTYIRHSYGAGGCSRGHCGSDDDSYGHCGGGC